MEEARVRGGGWNIRAWSGLQDAPRLPPGCLGPGGRGLSCTHSLQHEALCALRPATTPAKPAAPRRAPNKASSRVAPLRNVLYCNALRALRRRILPPPTGRPRHGQAACAHQALCGVHIRPLPYANSGPVGAELPATCWRAAHTAQHNSGLEAQAGGRWRIRRSTRLSQHSPASERVPHAARTLTQGVGAAAMCFGMAALLLSRRRGEGGADGTARPPAHPPTGSRHPEQRTSSTACWWRGCRGNSTMRTTRRRGHGK